MNMTVKIEQTEGGVPQKELDFLIKGKLLSKHKRGSCMFEVFKNTQIYAMVIVMVSHFL